MTFGSLADNVTPREASESKKESIPRKRSLQQKPVNLKAKYFEKTKPPAEDWYFLVEGKSDSGGLKESESRSRRNSGLIIHPRKYKTVRREQWTFVQHWSVASNIYTLPNVPRLAEPGQSNYRLGFSKLKMLCTYWIQTSVFSFCITSYWLCI